MKQVLKAILVLVLILGILAAAGWYFFIERPDLTTNALLYWAHRFEDQERHNRSIPLYEWAGKLQPLDDRIPRWLAEAYIADGNYTKAEYTLVSAITAMPDSVELYCSLSRTYVAQDKLLDAANMLERITNDAVRQRIQQLRPHDPVVSPEGGDYSEYIDVTATANGGNVYLTTDGDFPSLATDAYTSPISLPGGETSVMALSVADNGLVSSLVSVDYAVGSVVETVRLSDPTLEEYVREILGKTNGEALMSDQLWSITELYLPEDMQTLADLSNFAGLTTLGLHDLGAMDISVLTSLPSLQSLDLSGCILSSAALETIGALPELRELVLHDCALDDMTALASLSQLEVLDLRNNTIRDLTAVSSMTALKELYLDNNPIDSISYLSNCPALEILSMDSCGVRQLTALSGSFALRELHAAHNQIEDISVLRNCVALSVLDVSFNQVEDISVLSGFPELTKFSGDNNQITAVPDFDSSSILVQFNANHNNIEDVSGLAGLMWLNYVRVDYNKVKDVSCLKDNYVLVQIDAWDNPLDLEPIEEMQELGIIVNYNPTYEPPEETTEETDPEA